MSGCARVSVKVPHFTERVAEAQWLVGHSEMTSELSLVLTGIF